MVKVNVSHSVVSNSLQPHGSSPPGSFVPGILQARVLEWIAFPSPGDLPDPEIEPMSPALKADSLPAEPPREVKNGQNSQVKYRL